MLKLLRENKKTPTSTSFQQKEKPKQQQRIPFSESFSDLKYLSSFCYTNFNGVFPTSSSTDVSPKTNHDYPKFNKQQRSNSLINNNNLRKSTPDISTLKTSLKKNFSLSSTNFNNKPTNTTKQFFPIKSPSKKATTTPYKPQTPSKLNSRTIQNKPKMKRNLSQPDFNIKNSPNYYLSNKDDINDNTNFDFDNIASITQLNKISTMNNFVDVKNALNSLKANYLAKLKSKLNDNNYTQSHLSSSVNNLTKHLKDLNKEYNKSKENNISIMNQSVKLNGDLKRLLLQNKDVGHVIKKDRNECEIMRKQINELDEGKLLIENQCEILQLEISEMKKQSKLLPNLINKCEEDRKNLMTAILIVKKKSDEIKREIFKMNNNKNFMGQDLRSIVSYYKNAQV